MKAFLIDPDAKRVSEIVTDGSPKELHEFIGCDVLTTIYPRRKSPRLIGWLDDMGLMHEEKDIGGLWEIRGHDGILAGRCVLLGLDDGEGDHVDCPLKQAMVEAAVTWRPDLEFRGLITTQDEVVHPIVGKSMHIKTEAVFAKREKTDGQA